MLARFRPRALALLTLAAAVTLMGPQPKGRGASSPDPVMRERDGGLYPSDWFGAQRAFPGTTIPQERWRAAVQQTLLERSLHGLRTSDAGPSLMWEEVGPSNIGGRVTAIAAPPNGGTVYLGSADGGVWKSVDNGANFAPVFDAVGVPSIGAIALSPNDPNTVYVGTGENNGAVDNYDG